MVYLYETLISHPLLNALIFFYNTIAFHDIGLAIIALTIALRIILFPLFQKSARYQIVMQQMQPKLNKLKDTHKDDMRAQSEAMMALYKEYNINPFSGFLFLLIQLPILIGLYRIFLQIFSATIFNGLYSFVHAPAHLNNMFLGLINIQSPSIVIVLLAALAQYWQIKMTLPKLAPGYTPSSAELLTRRVALIGPILTVIIFFRLPAAVSLYWFVSSLISILQQAIINRQLRSHGKLGTIH